MDVMREDLQVAGKAGKGSAVVMSNRSRKYNKLT